MKEESKTKKVVKKTAPKTVSKKVVKTTKAAPKKTSVKKIAAPKTSASKKSTVKKTLTPKKTVVKKESTAVKTSTSKPAVKKVATKVSTTKKVAPKVEEKKVETAVVASKVESQKLEGELNQKLVLRVVLVVAFTLIFIIFVMGIIDTMINPFRYGGSQPSYIISNNILKESNVIDVREAKYKLKPLNGDYFVYVSYSSNKINSFERKLVEMLDKYDIKDKFYYINANPIKEYDNQVELANKYLGYTDVLISKIPTIVYVNKDNIVRIENIITRSDNNMISTGDFQNLLDINGFKAKK